MLFFILSGFLMAHLYFQRSSSAANIKRYTLARVGRIFPLYFAVVFASYALNQFDTDVLYDINTHTDIVAHSLFLFGDDVLWTISPEIHFYWLFILFWLMAKNRRGYIYVALCTVLIGLFLSNFPRITGDVAGVQYNIFHILRSLPYFFVGMLMGMHYRSLSIPAYLKSHWFLLTILLIPQLFPAFSPVTSDAKTRMWLSYEVLFVMASVFFSVVFLVPDHNRILANRIGDFLGKISFSLYLLHVPIIAQVTKLDINVEAKLAVSLTLSIVVAYLSYRFLERPSASIIRKLSTSPSSQ